MKTLDDIRNYYFCKSYYQRYQYKKAHNQRFFDDSIDIYPLIVQKLNLDNYTDGKKLSIDKIIELIDKRQNIINFDLVYKKLIVHIDALIYRNDHWCLYVAYEKSYPRSSESKIIDLILQVLNYYMIEVNKLYILSLNADYINQGKLNGHELFEITKYLYASKNKKGISTKTIIKNSPKLRLDEVLFKLENIDNIKKCHHKSRCEEYNDCVVKKLPNTLICRLNNYQSLGPEVIKKYPYFDKIPYELLKNKRQYAQVYASHHQYYLDKNNLINLLKDQIKYPLIYLDFEWKTCAIPPYEKMGINSSLVFQYSMHIQNKQGELTHFEFLGKDDCREEFIKSLLNNLPNEGTIISYNANGAEKYQLKQLSRVFPQYEDELKKVNERFFDLSKIFIDGYFYHIDFNGSFSLKNIVKTLCGVDYQKLEISDGLDAVEKYLEYQKSGYHDSKLRDELLSYCKMDTYSEYLIYNKIIELLKKEGIENA